MSRGQPSESGLRVLRVDASARTVGSNGRALADGFLSNLAEAQGGLRIVHRDLAVTPPAQVDAAWVTANTTAEVTRTAEQRARLAESDELVGELQAADMLLLVTPIYNFSVPAALKAWIDLVCRARLTFQYGPNGPEGLMTHVRAVVILTSGGTAVGSRIDFASGYVAHILGFIGVRDVTIVAADRLFAENSPSLGRAAEELARLARDLAEAPQRSPAEESSL